MFRALLLVTYLLAMIAVLLRPAPLESAAVVHVSGIEAFTDLRADPGQDSGARIIVAVTRGYRQEPPVRKVPFTHVYIEITTPWCEQDDARCDRTRRIVASGLIPPSDFIVDERISRAELEVRLMGRDVLSGEAANVFVNLTWRGHGRFQRSFDHANGLREDGQRFTLSAFHVARQASVQGSVGDWAVSGTGTLARLGSVNVLPIN